MLYSQLLAWCGQWAIWRSRCRWARGDSGEGPGTESRPDTRKWPESPSPTAGSPNLDKSAEYGQFGAWLMTTIYQLTALWSCSSCVYIQGPHPSKVAFQDRLHHSATRLSQYGGSSKCVLPAPGNGGSRWVLPAPTYPMIHCASLTNFFSEKERLELREPTATTICVTKTISHGSRMRKASARWIYIVSHKWSCIKRPKMNHESYDPWSIYLFVCFSSKITQRLLDGLPQNSVEGCDVGQGRTHKVLVRTPEFFFSLSLTLWDLFLHCHWISKE